MKIYDGVILDIMMQKIDGLTVLKKLRSQGNTIPVLLLTAKSELDDKVTGLDAGANDYLTKPFAAKELLARIRAMTRGQNQAVDAALTAGNLTLNLASYELSSPAGSFRLANKVFQMMEMLMGNLRNLTLIMGLINILNYQKIIQDAEHVLHILSENNESFPKKSFFRTRATGSDKARKVIF